MFNNDHIYRFAQQICVLKSSNRVGFICYTPTFKTYRYSPRPECSGTSTPLSDHHNGLSVFVSAKERQTEAPFADYKNSKATNQLKRNAGIASNKP